MAGEPYDTDRVLTLPNVLSFIRLLGVPLFLWLLLERESDIWAVVVLVVGGATDWLDGQIARRWHLRSRLGQVLDPVADRLYILATLIGFAIREIVPWWLVVLLAARDLLMVTTIGPGLRRRGFASLPVHFLGKAATFALLYAFPLVLLGERVFGAPADHVTMNNVEAARAATQHLIDLGRRRIAVIGAHEGEDIGSAALRIRGYRQALDSSGLPFDPALLGEAGPWRRSTGAEAMRRLLDAGVEVDAVFALNDALALGALHVLHARRVAVPQQIAVIGFDDIDDAAYSSPTLSTVSPGREEIARTAVELLVARIAGGSGGSGALPYQQVVADYSIVVRESTAGEASAPTGAA